MAWRSTILGLVALALIGGASPPSFAQSTGTQNAAPQATESQAAESQTADAPKGEPAEPSPPAAVTDQSVSAAELIIRLLPLTVDELKTTAEAWLNIVKAKTQEMADMQVSIMRSQGAVEDFARNRLTEMATERKRLFENYNAVVDAWEKKGGSADEIAVFRAYRSAIIVEETRTADYQTLLQEALAWAKSDEGGIRLAIQAAVVIIALIVLILAARMVRGGARRAARRIPNLSQLLLAFLTGVVYWLTIAIGLLIVLSAVGIDISPLFALFGGAAFIMAFALQDTLGNLASGLMIMINRPFDVGDYVNAAGVAGTVKAVSIVSTTVATPDNQIIIIPNKSVWGNVITNVTTSTTRRVDLVFGIGYQDSIEDAQRVLEEIVAAHELVLAEPAPNIRVNELGDSSVNFICRPWVHTANYWTVYWDLHRQVKERFDAEGISIPFPQRDVHLYTTVASGAAAGAAAMGLLNEPANGTGIAQNSPGYNEDADGEKNDDGLNE